MRIVLLLMLGMLSFSIQPACAQGEMDSIKTFLKERFGFADEDCYRADHGDIITKELPAENTFEVAVCGAMRIAVPFDLAVSNSEHMELFRKNPNVPEIGKFSTPPRIEDLDQFTLEEEDLKALKDCRSGNCLVKLPAPLMDQFRTEINWDSPDHGLRVLAMTKRNYVDFVTAYGSGGNGALINYDDMRYPQTRADEYHDLIRESPNLSEWGNEFYRYLDNPGSGPLPNSSIETIWQKEIFSGAKPTTTINQVVVYTPDSARQLTLVASKQLYADHFFEASITVAAIVGIAGDTSGIYLVYLNRSNYDDLRKTGLFSFTGRVRHEIFKQVERDLIWTRERIKAVAMTKSK